MIGRACVAVLALVSCGCRRIRLGRLGPSDQQRQPAYDDPQRAHPRLRAVARPRGGGRGRRRRLVPDQPGAVLVLRGRSRRALGRRRLVLDPAGPDVRGWVRARFRRLAGGRREGGALRERDECPAQPVHPCAPQHRMHGVHRRGHLPHPLLRDHVFDSPLQQRRNADDRADPAEHGQPSSWTDTCTSGARRRRCSGRTPSRCRRARRWCSAHSTVSGVAGQSGSITISYRGGYGSLSGKAVALEPATGFAFDSPMLVKPH